MAMEDIDAGDKPDLTLPCPASGGRTGTGKTDSHDQ